VGHERGAPWLGIRGIWVARQVTWVHGTWTRLAGQKKVKVHGTWVMKHGNFQVLRNYWTGRCVCGGGWVMSLVGGNLTDFLWGIPRGVPWSGEGGDGRMCR